MENKQLLGQNPSNTDNKDKNRQVGLLQAKKRPHSKRNTQKTTWKIAENICELWDLYPEYINSPRNSTTKQPIQLRNGQRINTNG